MLIECNFEKFKAMLCYLEIRLIEMKGEINISEELFIIVYVTNFLYWNIHSNNNNNIFLDYFNLIDPFSYEYEKLLVFLIVYNTCDG